VRLNQTEARNKLPSRSVNTTRNGNIVPLYTTRYAQYEKRHVSAARDSLTCQKFETKVTML